MWIYRVDGGSQSLRLLGLVVKSVPGVIIVGREHRPELETAGEVVMAVEVPVAADLNEPGTTAGSSGGPWFIQISGNWYLNGHNDFTSSLQFGSMFSPYYDDTWHALYNKAEQT